MFSLSPSREARQGCGGERAPLDEVRGLAGVAGPAHHPPPAPPGPPPAHLRPPPAWLTLAHLRPGSPPPPDECEFRAHRTARPPHSSPCSPAPPARRGPLDEVSGMARAGEVNGAGEG